MWKAWLEWLKVHAGPRVYFVIFLTGALGLRCSEALALKREDISMGGDEPRVRITGEQAGARKSPGEVYIRKQHQQIMAEALTNGISAVRTKGHKY
eukprot:3660569-Pyramimonas_sp.AAC.1